MKIENIPPSLLGAVRQRLGADDESDDSKDARIKRMSSIELVGAYSGWEIGGDSWGRKFVGIYLHLEEISKQEKETEVIKICHMN